MNRPLKKRNSSLKLYSGHVPKGAGDGKQVVSPKFVIGTDLAKVDRNLPRLNIRETKSPNLPNSKNVLPEIQKNKTKLLTGTLAGLPPQESSVVRIFISSTFSDYRSERNTLMCEANPKLKEFCRGLNLDFQLVDMRWGISNDLVKNHMTAKLCFQEITNCQQVSLGPNFMVMLGNRYGRSHCPIEISDAVFHQLKRQAILMGYATDELLEVWYKKDENAVPAVYVLQPITTVLPNFDNASDEETRKEEMNKWWTIEQELREFLQELAEAAYESRNITEETKHRFEVSVTELEVQQGILQNPDADGQTLSYYRNFTDKNKAQPEDRKYFLESDLKSRRHLKELATTKLSRKLGSVNRRVYNVNGWAEQGYTASKHEEGQAYLKEFNDDFVQSIQRLILSAVERNKVTETFDSVSTIRTEDQVQGQDVSRRLYSEILHHLHFCVNKCRLFCGRTEELHAIRIYLNLAGSKQPMFVYGSSGSGKTALMAMVAHLSKTSRWLGDQAVTVIRFLGTSPYTGDIHRVLTLITSQILTHYDIPLQPRRFSKYTQCVKYFHEVLKLVSQKHCTPSKPLVIILDSIDQLSQENAAHNFSWLPMHCPPNVNIVCSFIPSAFNLLKNAYRIVGNDDRYIKLDNMSTETGEEIIKMFLEMKKRTLHAEQIEKLIDTFNLDSIPLYLRLLLDEAVMWKSYTDISECVLGSTVREAINHLFKKLETNYGEIFVTHALGYITEGKGGLSQVEVEDVLSINNEVLNAVYQYHSPPIPGIVRIPAHLWPRLHLDLRNYLVERQTQNKVTFFWYHRQFIEAARERYVQNKEQKQTFNSDLSELFLAKNGVKKTIVLQKRNGMVIENADRQVTWQPLDEKNVRMLSVLPYHLVNAGNRIVLKERVLCNLKFIISKLKAFGNSGIYDLIEDYEVALDEFNDFELAAIRDFLRFSEQEIRDNINSLFVQLIGQLEDLSGEHMYIRRLCADAKAALSESGIPAIVPLFGCLPSSYGSELKWYAEGPSKLLAVSDDQSLALVLSEEFEGRLRIPTYQIINLDLMEVTKSLRDKNSSESFSGKANHRPPACFSSDKSFVYILSLSGVVAFSVASLKRVEYSTTLDSANTMDEIIVSSPVMPNMYIIGGESKLAIVEDMASGAEGKWVQKVRRTFTLVESEKVTNILVAENTGNIVSTHVKETESQKSSIIAIWCSAGKKLLFKVPLLSVVGKNMISLTSACDMAVGSTIYGEVFGISMASKSFDTEFLSLPKNKEEGLVQIVRFHKRSRIMLLTTKKVLHAYHMMNGSLLRSAKYCRSSSITCMDMSNNGESFVMGDSAGNITIWQTDELKELKLIKAHAQQVSDVLYMDEYAVSLSEDKTVKMWECQSMLAAANEDDKDGLAVHLTAAPTSILEDDSVNSVLMTADMQCLITSSTKEPPTVWSAATGELISKCSGNEAFPRSVLCFNDLALVGLSCHGKLSAWNIPDGSVRNTPHLKEGCVKVVTATKGGKHVITVGNEPDNSSDVVKISDLQQVLRKIKLSGHIDGVISGILLSGDEHTLVLKLENDTYKAVILESDSSPLYDCQLEQTTKTGTEIINVAGYCICPYKDKSFIVGCRGWCTVWKPGTLSAKPDLPSFITWLQPSRHKYLSQGRKNVHIKQIPVTSVCSLHSGDIIVTGSRDGTIILWEEGTTMRDYRATILQVNSSAVTSLVPFERFPYFISSSSDKTIRLWNHSTADKPEAAILTHMQLTQVSLIEPADGGKVKQAVVVATGKNLDIRKALVFKVNNIK